MKNINKLLMISILFAGSMFTQESTNTTEKLTANEKELFAAIEKDDAQKVNELLQSRPWWKF